MHNFLIDVFIMDSRLLFNQPSFSAFAVGYTVLEAAMADSFCVMSKRLREKVQNIRH